jgi:hypothetical protein
MSGGESMIQRQEVEFTEQELLKQQIINLQANTACLQLAIKAGEFFFGIISGESFAILCSRTALLIRGAWLPGMGDTNTIAGLTNKAERTIDGVLTRKPRNKYQVGSTAMYRLDEMPLPGDDPDEEPQKVAPAKRK